MNQSERAAKQERWNEFGMARRLDIEQNPGRYRITVCPISDREFHDEFLTLLAPLPGKHLLELGFGRGELSVWLAMQGALVTAIDLGQELVAAATALARLNGVSCEFRQGNVAEMGEIPSGSFDAVTGVAILHHLPEGEVVRVLRECQRVLRPGGVAVFAEPVENSRLFDLLQNLFPAGKKDSSYYRPSILNRRRWKAYVENLDDRTMTHQEFRAAGQGLFPVTRIASYGFLIRLIRLFGPSSRESLMAVDRILFQYVPPLRHFCRTALVTYKKS